MSDRRLSDPAANVLQLFHDDPTRAFFGREIIEMLGLRSGALYPILHRFENRRLLASEWEDFDTAVAHGRRPRRLYRLDPSGADAAAAALRKHARATTRRSQPQPGPATT